MQYDAVLTLNPVENFAGKHLPHVFARISHLRSMIGVN
jgi:hypothetical protein